jgi:hypothetical protein
MAYHYPSQEHLSRVGAMPAKLKSIPIQTGVASVIPGAPP